MNRVLHRVLLLTLLLCLACPLARADYATLQYGSRGSSVLSLQLALARLGYQIGTPDSKYGANTENAVRAFQRDHQLKVDGKAGKQTQALIYQLSGIASGAAPTAAPTAITGTKPTRTLRSGSVGADVVRVQSRLKELGYYAGTAHGTYDTATMAAVTAFQIYNRLDVDGVAGSMTCTRMFSQSAVAYPAAAAVPAVTAAPTALPVSPTIPTRTLREGSYGTDVLSMQQRLQNLGYYTGTLTGVYDTATQSAVRVFQQYNGLTMDGVAGTTTFALLYSASAIAYPGVVNPNPLPAATPQQTTAPAYQIPTRTLRLNYSGSDVLSVQQRLQALGYYSGALSGIYQADTLNAVRAFQQRNGLSADGLAGTSTCAKLFAVSAVPAQTASAAATPTPSPAPTPTPTPTQTNQVPSRTLRTGCTGSDVAVLQRRLAELGYFTTTVTGEYNASTANAVRAFQQRNSLAADGVAGAKTYAALFSQNALPAPASTAAPLPAQPTAAPAAYQTLASGSSGENVTRLQQRLLALGYNVSVTGKYDSATVSAVKQFQTNNYLGVDGIAGKETQTMLYSASPSGPSDTPTQSYTTLSVNTANNNAALLTMQNRLVELGYLMRANGIYDGTTHNAVVAFQQRNGLMISGIANGATQARMFSSSAQPYSAPVTELPADTGRISTPTGVKALWWYADIKPTIKSGQTVVVFDPGTNLSWNIKLYSLGHHADSQPATWQDTQIMNRSFGSTSWDCHPVYVQLPSGTWVIAAMHNYPHLYGTISDNGFGGHLCIHFLRDINECISAGDSNYGVSMQKAIRSHWQNLTGETID